MTPPVAVRRDKRIELRASDEEKELLTRAAAEERLDLTTYIMRLAIPAARRKVREIEQIRLSERDSARVLHLLESPPEPTPALEKAVRGFLAHRG